MTLFDKWLLGYYLKHLGYIWTTTMYTPDNLFCRLWSTMKLIKKIFKDCLTNYKDYDIL